MQILLIGVGKSSMHIIEELSKISGIFDFTFVVADLSDINLESKCNGLNCIQLKLDTGSIEELTPHIAASFIVISMLPPAFHLAVAKVCLMHRAHLITPSYISDEMLMLDTQAKNADLIFLNEMGLDPGIDHMCCMKIIQEQKSQGAVIISLKSHCGALVAPQSDTNLWHYKVSWNPRNVVLAGSGNDFIKYRENGKDILLKYKTLFSHTAEINIGNDIFESYPNRDSLKYQSAYDLEGITTLYRGTLRIPPFCKAWNELVKFGATSISESFPKIIEADLSGDTQIIAMFEELGVFELHKQKGLAFEVLQNAIEQKWAMQEHEIDRVAMIHEIGLEQNGFRQKIISSLILDGENQMHTALSKTVGLPIVFSVELILKKMIKGRGVLMPINKEFYEPILQKLETYGVKFTETKT